MDLCFFDSIDFGFCMLKILGLGLYGFGGLDYIGCFGCMDLVVLGFIDFGF